MKPSWGGTEDIGERRQVSPPLKVPENPRAVPIDVEYNVADRGDRILPSRAAGCDGVHTHIHTPTRRIPEPQPRLEARRSHS
jgi:hypothetical protein